MLLELFEEHAKMDKVESEDERDVTNEESELANKILSKLGIRLDFEEDIMKHQRQRLMKDL